MITLRDIAVALEPISGQATGSDVFESFEADPDLMAIAVVDDDNVPIGLIERNQFSLRLGSAYGRALYAGRPITLIMDPGPLIADEQAPVSHFTEEALARRPADLMKGIIVVADGRYRGIVTITDLLKSTTSRSRLHAEALEELAEGLSAAKAEAQNANILLREALDAMSEGVAVFTAQDDYVLWNTKYEQSHHESCDILRPGLPFEALLRHGLARGQYVEAVGREAAWLKSRLASRAGLVDRTSEEQELPDGRFIRVEDTRLSSGGSISVAVDITAIKRRGASFLFLFEHNPVPLAVFDRETFDILAVNDAACLQYGYAKAELTRMTVLDVLAPEEKQAVLEAQDRGDLDLDDPEQRHRSHVTASGERLKVQMYLRPLVYEGRPALLAAAIDMTAQDRAETSLKVAVEEAESANRAKSEFLANMSHEIRTPLNGVLGVVSVLSQTELTAAQTEMMGIVETSARTLQVLLGDLLDISKIESGLLELQPDVMNPVEVGHQVASLFRALAAEKGLDFTLEMDAGCSQPVLGDRTRLAQIITNLCSNAVKFTDAGQVTLSLTSEARGPAQRLTLSVSDTGVGISAAGRARLFERFSQADGTITRRFGGTGLGLAISQQLARLMGGEIRVESVEGQGSTFTATLEFPRAEARGAAPAPSPPTLAPPRAEDRSQPGLRVLLVEDHAINRKVIALIIADLVDLTVAENGAEGVEAEARCDFDLILMDMQMPVMDGVTATRLIRARERAEGRRRTPIIMLTANVLPEHVEACLEAGADRHLSKPISATSLIAAIEAVFEDGADAAASSDAMVKLDRRQSSC